jgi:hypothetical protein
MRHVELIVFTPVVLPEENLDMMPRALYRVGVGPGVGIDEADAVVNSAMRVTLRTKIVVRTPAATDDRSAGFDPVTYDSHQCVGGSVLYGNKKCSAGLTFYTAKHPLTLNRVSPMKFSPTELALVNFDSFVTSTDLDGAALQKHMHGFPTEHSPVCDCICTQGIFLSDVVGLFAARDVVGK